MRRLPVDNWGIPTGATEEWPAGTEALGTTELDQGFDKVAEGSLFAISGGDRRVEVKFDKGYPAAQIFAPRADDVVGIEPMAAPTDALRRGNYRLAIPGKPETTRFSIRVG
jgi:hypothetical protein